MRTTKTDPQKSLTNCQDALGYSMGLTLRRHLSRVGVKTIKDLASMTKKEFLSIPRVGALRFSEARRFLLDNGYDWPACAAEVKYSSVPVGVHGKDASALVSSIERLSAALSEMAAALNGEARS